jgi:transcriptional regulator with XRE-family HTH domain
MKKTISGSNKIKEKSPATGEFVTILNKLLQHHSLSYRNFAKAIGITHPYLFRLSKGKHANPGIDVINKMSKFFKISIPQLLGEQEINFKNRPKNLAFDEE